jgi:hypothetical protein
VLQSDLSDGPKQCLCDGSSPNEGVYVRLDRLLAIAVTVAYGRHDHTDLRIPGLDASRRLNTIHLWHGQINGHHVRQELIDQPDDFDATCGFADDLQTSILRQAVYAQ